MYLILVLQYAKKNLLIFVPTQFFFSDGKIVGEGNLVRSLDLTMRLAARGL